VRLRIEPRACRPPLAACACAAAVLALGARPAQAEWVTRITDGIMGTRITIELWADDPKEAQSAIDAVLDEMRHVDASMSTYKPSSEVSQVNAHAADGPMRISRELFDLLETSRQYSELTEGAFDITYASVGYLYDFRKRVRPTDAEIAAALPAVNYEHVLLDPEHGTVAFSRKGVRIDLGGIAKGYAVDCGIDILAARGFTRAYVGAGGDSRIIGDRFGQPWVVGIRDPRKGPDDVITRVPLVNAAISTSGDYERFFDEGGQRYHHIIDPHTGHSASRVRSATVIGPYATRTDGLSKTAFVLGPEKAMEIYNRIDDIDAIIVELDGTVLYSKGMHPAAGGGTAAAAP
jgi:thiamine biosynthesis lipoprotein